MDVLIGEPYWDQRRGHRKTGTSSRSGGHCINPLRGVKLTGHSIGRLAEPRIDAAQQWKAGPAPDAWPRLAPVQQTSAELVKSGPCRVPC